MGRDTTNREGLTFEEWVCAAGVAVFNQEEVRPYSKSEVSYRSTALMRPEQLRPLELMERRLSPHLRVARRQTTVFYPKKVRKAWFEGEDPTDWRAQA